jgi:hypothetical protein
MLKSVDHPPVPAPSESVFSGRDLLPGVYQVAQKSPLVTLEC